MTFKHVKFGDSVTMRSLERVAQEKGWIQEDPKLHKTASFKEVDLTPTDSLMENVMRLCAGLRQSGFDKHAEQIENLFVIYKQSDKTDKCYDVSGEEGKDLVEAAHPEGGHQMENVEGDAYVEDILEKHLKMLDVADSDPKAKLASNSRSVLDAVKVALGAPPLGFQEVNLPTAPSGWGRLMNMVGKSPQIELAGEGGEAAEAVGAGAATGEGGAAVGAGAAGALGGAVLVGAIGGAMIGNALFDTYLAPDQLTEAGKRLISKADDFREASLWNDQLGDKASGYLDNFKEAFETAISNYLAIAYIKKDPRNAPEALPALKKLDDALMESNKWAQDLWSFADSKMSDKWLSFRFSPLTNYQDIVVLAGNYMKLANRIHASISKFVYDATMATVQKQQQQHQGRVSNEGGTEGDALVQQYSGVLQDISRYAAVIKAKKPQNAAALLQWLGKAASVVKAQQAAYQQVESSNKPAVVKIYTDKLSALKAKIDAFNTNWIA